MKLTKRTLETLACDPNRKDRIHFDDDLPGFGLRVTAAGGKMWLIQYRASGIIRRMKIGNATILEPDKARILAKELLGRVAGGSDPFAEKQANIEAARQAARKVADDVRADDLTLRRLIDAYDDKYASRKRSGTESIRAIRFGFASWLDRPANSFSIPEMVNRFDAMVENQGGPMANRTLAYARKMFNWAVARQMIPASPLAGLPAPAIERSRDRTLSTEELKAVWIACEGLSYPLSQMIKILLLTLQRRSEVAEMRWPELSNDLSTWTIPAERAKNGKAHIVHLSSQAQEALATIHRIAHCPFVFTTTGKTPVSGFSKAKATLDAMSRVGHWRLHDFRRTGVTALADMGFAPHVCDRLLNHVSGTISGVAAVYQRSEFLIERKRALEAWGTHIEGLTNRYSLTSKIVRLDNSQAA